MDPQIEDSQINPVVKYVANRIKANKDCNIVVTGSTGSGKSYAGARCGFEVAQKLKTNFTTKDNISFNVPELMKLTELPQNQKVGTVFMLEEAGAMGGGAASRDWQSKYNRFFSGWMQTKRHRNQVLIATLPFLKFVDSQARLLFHMRMCMRGIDRSRKLGFTRIYVVQVNDISEKVYIKRFRMRDEHNRLHKIDKIAWAIPPDSIRVPYEDIKRKFTDSYNKSIVQEKISTRREPKVTPEKILAFQKRGMNFADMAAECHTSYNNVWNIARSNRILAKNSVLNGIRT